MGDSVRTVRTVRTACTARGRRALALGLYAAAVLLVPLGSTMPGLGDEPAESPTPLARDAVARPTVGALATEAAGPRRATPEALKMLAGIWMRYEAGVEGDRVRFYYFHGDGTGLYRYGRVGLNNTHSFDYDVHDDRLVIDFRKTGDHHEVPFSLTLGRDGDEGRDWLELGDDPREPGATRYFRESDAVVRGRAEDDARTGPAPAGHMWIDLESYATGGRGFVMYQFRPAGLDGRGVGWFHRGDFDDWSTEALTYRIAGRRIELTFPLAEQWEASPFIVTTDAEGSRWLELEDDPRDFWHPHRYADMGPSFGVALAPFELDPRRR